MTAQIETYKQFAFEAAHELPPYSGLHGHTFFVGIHLVGEPDPEFGWSADLYEGDRKIETLRQTLHETYLNKIPGLEKPSLENVAAWVYENLKAAFPNLDRIHLWRGIQGHAEGCIYRR